MSWLFPNNSGLLDMIKKIRDRWTWKTNRYDPEHPEKFSGYEDWKCCKVHSRPGPKTEPPKERKRPGYNPPPDDRVEVKPSTPMPGKSDNIETIEVGIETFKKLLGESELLHSLSEWNLIDWKGYDKRRGESEKETHVHENRIEKVSYLISASRDIDNYRFRKNGVYYLKENVFKPWHEILDEDVERFYNEVKRNE